MEKKNGNMGVLLAAAVVVILAAAGFFVYSNGNGAAAAVNTSGSGHSSSAGAGRALQVVAAENFWGSLAAQLCGIHCNVTSIVTDPNTDPHDYEASTTDAREIANANFVIVNGVGYDDWALQLLAASPNPNRMVLDVAQNLGISNGSNPHLWYNPAYVNATVKQMYLDLVAMDPNNASYYKQQYENVTDSLATVDGRIAAIKSQFAGTKVASTESIFVYLANASGLDLVSPPEFMDAVAEGNDPPEQSVATFEDQLESGNVSVLVYNEQTVTPLTTEMKQIAVEHNVTIVGVTETIQPPNVSFETWMNSELLQLQNALNANALGN